MQLHVFVEPTLEDIANIYTYCESNRNQVNNEAAIDTETTGLNTFKDIIVGVSVSLYEDEGFYVVTHQYNKELDIAVKTIKPEVEHALINLMEYLRSWKLIGHNILYDRFMILKDYQIDYVNSIYIDTLLLKHTVKSDKPFGLKEIASIEFGAESVQEQTDLKASVLANGGKWNKTAKEMYKADPLILGKYGAMDTCLTLKVMNRFLPKLKEFGLESLFFDDIVMPLYRECTIPMKELGFPVDVEYFIQKKLDVEAQINRIKGELYDEVKEDIYQIEQVILNEECKKRSTGLFAEFLCEQVSLTPPINKKTGNFTFAKSDIKKWAEVEIRRSNEDQIKVIWYLTGECDKLGVDLIRDTQLALYRHRNPDDLSPYNLFSDKQLPQLLHLWGLESDKVTDGGDESFDKDVLKNFALDRLKEDGYTPEQVIETYSRLIDDEETLPECNWFIKYTRCKRLMKLVSTYIDIVLDNQHNGSVHPDIKQFGTITGRYSFAKPNLQNLPAHSKLGQMIKKGFVSETK